MTTLRIEYKPSGKRGALLRETIFVSSYRVSEGALIYTLLNSGKTIIVPLSEIKKLEAHKKEKPEKGIGGADEREPEMS